MKILTPYKKPEANSIEYSLIQIAVHLVIAFGKGGHYYLVRSNPVEFKWLNPVGYGCLGAHYTTIEMAIYDAKLRGFIVNVYSQY